MNSFFQRLLGKNSEEKEIKNSDVSIPEEEIAAQLQKKLQIFFSDISLVITALKHRSYLNISNEERVASNERLEFLGDAVLDLVVTYSLFKKFPKRAEGQLSKIKSILVSKPVLAEMATNLSLGNFILLNKGEEKTGGRNRQSILADCFEAIIGAIYIDKGLEEADKFIQQNLFAKFKSIMQRELYKNYKSMLLEYSQSKLGSLPDYRLISETGPDHDKKFKISVLINGKVVGSGVGKSKKNAEQEAAKQAIQKLGLLKAGN